MLGGGWKSTDKSLHAHIFFFLLSFAQIYTMINYSVPFELSLSASSNQTLSYFI